MLPHPIEEGEYECMTEIEVAVIIRDDIALVGYPFG